MEEALPLVLVASVLISVATIIGLDNLHDRRNDKKRKLYDMNTLYRCDSCLRYSRKYYVDLKKDHDKTYVEKRMQFQEEMGMPISYYSHFCPHCEGGIASKSDSTEKWINTHPDAPLITMKNIRIFEKMKEEFSMLVYENTVNLTEKERDIDYLCNHMLLKISGHDES